ncbi:MAG: DEAD/DEAH box helicase [Pseudomonadota bacterium]
MATDILSALDRFNPQVRDWFSSRYAAPTRVQTEAWPVIARGDHTLITAPTGSGKTLTAFLWSIDGFLSGRLEHGATRVLYVSPLKALNNDIRRNLLTPLEELGAADGNGQIRVGVRSGDTESAERQRLLRRPPEILITTPESLNIMLTTRRGQLALNQIETVILDEIHALLDNRRGVQLLTALERLVDLTGEVQRVTLSATVHPLEAVARYVGGINQSGAERPVTIVAPPGSKAIELEVHFPAAARDVGTAGAIWDPLASAFREHIDHNRSTLLFTNSRRLAEKVAYKLNEQAGETLAFAHHGSLARNLRHEVESRMKAGAIKAIVATSSLEMGIDIGALDEVIMVQSPPSVAAGLQRLGRAGHQVDAVSRGSLYPTHPHDCLEAAVLAEGINERALEPAQLLENPLDILAQIILATCAVDPWPVDTVYALIRRAGPYRTLPRRAFDDVLAMLTGRYRGVRVSELKPRLDHDQQQDTIQATRGAVLALYLSGGSIPERGLYQLRHADSGSLIGELDEEFVWEAAIGQRFNLGSQSWQITRIDKNEVLVRHTEQSASLPPFWRADDLNRNPEFAERINRFLARADAALDAGEANQMTADLRERLHFDAVAAEELVDYLDRQRTHTHAPLPHRDHLLIEHTRTAPGGYSGAGDMTQSVIHTLWGGSINRPWAIALEAAYDRDTKAGADQTGAGFERTGPRRARPLSGAKRNHGQRPGGPVEIHVDNNCIVLQHDGTLDVLGLLASVTTGNLLELLRARLEGSGYFGAQFRQAAGRSLLLGRVNFRKRIPLWLIRQQAKKLLAAVKDFEDFPVLQETWRSCLRDEFDLPRLNQLLLRLEAGELAVTEVTTHTVSPFAAHAAYQQIMPYMYADDQPQSAPASSLSESALQLALDGSIERPRIDAEVLAGWEAKRQRRTEDYAPTDALDALRWIEDRLLLPEADWSNLTALELPGSQLFLIDQAQRQLVHANQLGALLRARLVNADRVRSFTPAVVQLAALGDGVTTAASAATLPEPHHDDERDRSELWLELLAGYGPRTRGELDALLPDFGTDADVFLARDDLVSGALRSDTNATTWCRRDVYESLLRYQRAQRRSSFAPQPMARWADYLWRWQQSEAEHPGTDPVLELAAWLQRLRGYPASIDFWLDTFAPTRTGTNSVPLLQAALAEAGLEWVGCGVGQICLLDPAERGLFAEPAEPQPPESSRSEITAAAAATEPEATADPAESLLDQLFIDPAARYDFLLLADRYQTRTGNSASELNRTLWALAWGGQLNTDTLLTLDRGRSQNFTLAVPRRSPRLNRRAPTGLMKGWPGNWRRLPAPAPAADPLSTLEQGRDKARVLLDRYGIVCREIANRDHPALRWSQVFPALRMMELAGEVVSGYFFDALSGPQFADPQALRQLANATPSWTGWVSTLDPVAPTGFGLVELALPPRRPGNALIFVGGQLALIVEGSGRRLRFLFDDAAVNVEAVQQLAKLLTHQGRTELDRINDAPPAQSTLLPLLREQLVVTADHRHLTLEARP